MAIADVARIGARDDTLCRPRFTADDEIVVAEIEILERDGHERKQPAVEAPQRIQTGHVYAVAPNGIGEPGRIAEEGVDVGIREHAAERFQNLFATAHAEQPVMDQSDAHLRTSLRVLIDGAIERAYAAPAH